MKGFGVEDLVVRYGRVTAVAGLTFEVSPGEILALVGADGSGKTSSLRALAGAIAPSGGRVFRPDELEVGYVSSDSGVYQDLTAEENLAFSGAAYGVKGKDLEKRIQALLESTNLTPARRRRAGALSGGMRQKLALAMALLHRPRLLILDEPTTGLDPMSRSELWARISRAAAEGASVVFSTTYIDEAERASFVVVLDAGKVLIESTPDDIVSSIPGRVVETTDRPKDGFAYRRGARFRVWDPEGRGGKPALTLDLQDAITVASLQSRAGGTEE